MIGNSLGVIYSREKQMFMILNHQKKAKLFW